MRSLTGKHKGPTKKSHDGARCRAGREIRRAHTILHALKEILAVAEAMQEEFWSDLDDGLDERYTEILLGLRKENDPEAAVIFSLRWLGWEICNDPELLLEEIAEFRRTMSLGEAARKTTGQCP